MIYLVLSLLIIGIDINNLFANLNYTNIAVIFLETNKQIDACINNEINHKKTRLYSFSSIFKGEKEENLLGNINKQKSCGTFFSDLYKKCFK